MSPRRIARVSAIALFSIGIAVVAGCSKKSDPVVTGGGGAGNTPFDSGVLSGGAMFQRTFPNVGTVGYHCALHRLAGMTGTITISASDTTSLANVTVAPGGSRTFSPGAVTIKPGGTVHWIWGSSGHTVTSD